MADESTKPGADAAADAADGRATFLVKPGVAWIDGAPVNGRTELRLTEQAAAFDLRGERLMRAGGKRPRSWRGARKKRQAE